MRLRCGVCGTEYTKRTSLLTRAFKLGAQTGLTCSRFCGTTRRAQLYPEVFKQVGERQRGVPAKGGYAAGVPRAPLSLEHRKQISETAKAKGHRPPERGGNGTGMTPSESRIAEVMLTLGFRWNYAVSLGSRQPGYPTNYKLDFGNPEKKVGLEVDGGSHNLLSRKAQDKKKTEKLATLGWTVFRLHNSMVPPKSGTYTLQDIITILPTEFWSTIATP